MEKYIFPKNFNAFFSKINRFEKIIFFILSFILIYIYIASKKIDYYYFDSFHYWHLSKKFINEGGNFSFLNFFDDYRGYFYPFILFLLRLVGSIIKIDGAIALNIFNALIFSIISAILTPYIFEKLFNIKFNLLSYALLIFLFFYFWRGSFLYPLSDFPSIFILLISMVLLIKLKENIKIYYKIILAFLLGITAYAIYNIRQIYLINIFIILFMAFFYLKDKLKTKIILIAFILIGFFICSIPQLLVNIKYLNNLNFLVVTKYSNENLLLHALKQGIIIQKYETNINTDIYQYNAVNLSDPLADKINININSINSYFDYFFVVVKNPLTFLLIYLKHFFNGLDIWYHQIYINNIFQNRNLFSFINYTLWFIFIFNIKNIYKKLNPLYSKIFLFFTIPIIFLIPMKTEVRYYLPLFLLCYGMVVVLITSKINNITNEIRKNNIKKFFKELILHIKKEKLNIIKIISLYFIFIVFCFILSFYTFTYIVK